VYTRFFGHVWHFENEDAMCLSREGARFYGAWYRRLELTSTSDGREKASLKRDWTLTGPSSLFMVSELLLVCSPFSFVVTVVRLVVLPSLTMDVTLLLPPLNMGEPNKDLSEGIDALPKGRATILINGWESRMAAAPRICPSSMLKKSLSALLSSPAVGGTSEKVDGMLVAELAVGQLSGALFALLNRAFCLKNPAPSLPSRGMTRTVTRAGWASTFARGDKEASPKLTMLGSEKLFSKGPTRPLIISSISGSAAAGAASKRHRTQRK
jgi:hypothetical protein